MVNKVTVSDMTLNTPFYNASTYLVVEYPHQGWGGNAIRGCFTPELEFLDLRWRKPGHLDR